MAAVAERSLPVVDLDDPGDGAGHGVNASFGRIVNMSVSFIKFPQSGFAHTHAARLALSGAVAAICA